MENPVPSRLDKTGVRERAIPALMLAAGAAWLAACAWFPLTDTDIWWHLASAKLMWARKAFLREDPFCQVSLGAPWTDLHWGFQILAYLAWKLGGAYALVAGKCLALACALGFALRPHLDRRTLPWLVPLACFGLYHVRFFIDARPLALTLLGLGIQYAAVMAYFSGSLKRPWLILVPVQIAMANVQGLYPLGALLVTCLVAGEWLGRGLPRRYPGLRFLSGSLPDLAIRPLRPLAWTCAAMWAAGLANPYGWDGFRLPLALLGRIAPVSTNIFSSQIAENLPFTQMLRERPAEAVPYLFMGLIAAYGFFGSRRRFSPGHAALFAAFALLGWMAQRNLPLAFVAGLMAVGRNLQASPGRSPSRIRDLAGWASLAAIMALYGPRIRSAWEYELPGRMETPFRFPVQAVDFLESRPLSGNLFNEIRYGGYLDFRLHPGKLSFVDGRMIVRSAEFYRDFLAAVDEPEGFDAYRARYGLTHALLPISEDRRFLPLAAHLVRENGWALLYCDGASALLAEAPALGLPLDSLPPGHPLREAVRARFAANPRLEAIALANAADFLRLAGRARAAADLEKIPRPRP